MSLTTGTGNVCIGAGGFGVAGIHLLSEEI